MAGELGIEPRIAESKSVVIPFHYSPTKLVPLDRIELPSEDYKSTVMPLY
jgi:hypothetical protein